MDYIVSSTEENIDFFFRGASIALIPWIVLGTVSVPIQLYSLVREIKHEFLWFKHWFCRMNVLYWYIILNLYGITGFDLFFYIAFYVDGEYNRNGENLPLRIPLDILMSISGFIVILSNIILLYRPILPNVFHKLCKCAFQHTYGEQFYNIAMDSVENMTETPPRKVPLIIVVAGLVLYCGGSIAVWCIALKKLYCYNTREERYHMYYYMCRPHL